LIIIYFRNIYNTLNSQAIFSLKATICNMQLDNEVSK